MGRSAVKWWTLTLGPSCAVDSRGETKIPLSACRERSASNTDRYINFCTTMPAPLCHVQARQAKGNLASPTLDRVTTWSALSKKLHHDLASTGRCLIFCFAPPISVKSQFQGPTLPSLHSFPSQLTIPPFRPHRVESRPKRHVRHSDVFCPAGRRSPSQASPQEGGRHGQKRSSECVISALRCHDFRLTRPRRAQGGSGQ